MPVNYPTGQKFNLRARYCFALIARLQPEGDPYQVIRTAEAFNHIKNVLLLFLLPVLYFSGLNYFAIGIITFLFMMTEGLLERFFWIGLLPDRVIRVLLFVAKAYRNVHFLKLSTIVLLATGFLMAGWLGALVYLAIYLLAKILLLILGEVLDTLIKSRTNLLGFRGFNQKLNSMDKNFFNSYLFFARKYHRPKRLNVYTWELDEDYWKPVYNKLFTEKPFAALKIRELSAA